MSKPSEPRDPQRDMAPARRTWEKPELIAYGHLSKLTRGPSGKYTETVGSMDKM